MYNIQPMQQILCNSNAFHVLVYHNNFFHIILFVFSGMIGFKRGREITFYDMPVKNTQLFFLSAFVVLAFLQSCSGAKYITYSPAQKIAPEKLKEDLLVLKKVQEANHPGLYWYTSKDSLDFYFNTVYNSITDSLTELRFRSKVAWYVNKIHCGHTSVRSSKEYLSYALTRKLPQFPLLLKAWDDSLVVIGVLNNKDSAFKRGAIITSVEGYSNRQLLDTMFSFISTDGYANNFKNQAVSANFPLYYSLAFPLKDSFAVAYIDSAGINQSAYVHLLKPVVDTSSHRPVAKPETPHISKKEIKAISLQRKRSLSIDTAGNFALMRISTFANAKLRSFFRQSFKVLEEQQVSSLIIDLRENGGGSLSASTVLTRYLKKQPFVIADTVESMNKHIQYNRYINPSMVYNFAMTFTTAKKQDGKYHFRNLEHKKYQPYTKYHFDGDVYLLQGGFTFSAATMFILQVKGQQNIKVVGEETGGGNYGTSAVYLPEIILPNSRLRIVQPLYRIVNNQHNVKNGKGISPDMYIGPSSDYIKAGIDKKMEAVIKMIGEKKK